ncbi:hypothetical protein CC86DRAFT_334158 [Ophiobolus disseminans]|uniref:DUF6536 domain-containing protein n=1 Tax=Ophiobolus disseminans TaxID=1469910 RepID=A0A6A6ZFP8_9PLEO|nr:hypothetical protein CC86DRAFT_334158 [Ophiobolus disseminans]
MLSASNLSLQLVSAPTKDDIVAAHKNEKWLDIGVPSLRNLKSIPWKRRAIWVILATSSLPIHFLFSLVIIFAFVVIVQGFLTQNKYYEQVSFSSIWELGFGTARHEEIISWNQSRNGSFGFFANIMVANVWQVLVSMLYLIFNAILSCQLLAAEWGQYGYERKTLRVSHPKGIQRGSYFISMPLRYGLPIIALFAILHWLISQSAFVIRVLQFDINGTPVPGFTMAGFSIMPCITALTLGILCLAGYLTTSLCRKYTYVPGMPFVSTCSLAISANCHRAALDKDVHLLPLQWGVYEVAGDPENVAKCAFTTSIHVRAPDVDDVLYGIPTEPAVPAKDDRRTTRPKRFARYWTDFWGESMTRLRRQKHE